MNDGLMCIGILELPSGIEGDLFVENYIQPTNWSTRCRETPINGKWLAAAVYATTAITVKNINCSEFFHSNLSFAIFNFFLCRRTRSIFILRPINKLWAITASNHARLQFCENNLWKFIFGMIDKPFEPISLSSSSNIQALVHQWFYIYWSFPCLLHCELVMFILYNSVKRLATQYFTTRLNVFIIQLSFALARLLQSYWLKCKSV